MGYDHTMLAAVKFPPGTSVATIAGLLAPYFDYAGGDALEALAQADAPGDDSFEYDPSTGTLFFNTAGEVKHSFGDIVQQLADNIGPHVAEPGEISLYDHSTGDIDNAISRYAYGRSPESIAFWRARRDLDEAFDVVGRYLPPALTASLRDRALDACGLLGDLSPGGLRRDAPDELLELLLFDGPPIGRAREVLEERFERNAGIPFLRRWLGSRADSRYGAFIIGANPEAYDGLEIHGVAELPDPQPHNPRATICEVDDENPDFYSVYAHRVCGGVTCVGDHGTIELARQYASELAEKHGWACPV